MFEGGCDFEWEAQLVGVMSGTELMLAEVKALQCRGPDCQCSNLIVSGVLCRSVGRSFLAGKVSVGRLCRNGGDSSVFVFFINPKGASGIDPRRRPGVNPSTTPFSESGLLLTKKDKHQLQSLVLPHHLPFAPLYGPVQAKIPNRKPNLA